VSIAGQQSKAMADQLTTVDKSRLLDKLCSLSITEMNNIQKAIKLQMDLT
jgi:mRNA-degrading endonuclease toxin of MazEF toxin-antitoxin module